MDALLARGVELRACRGDDLGEAIDGDPEIGGNGRGRSGDVENRVPFEVTAGGDVVVASDDGGVFRPQDLFDLLGSPDVELAFLPFAVGVLGGVEPAFGAGHLPDDVVQRFGDDAAIGFVAERAEGVEVDAGELGIVVEHLLEVGDQPDGVDRVAVKAAADLVVHPAGGHLVEGKPEHLRGAVVARPPVGSGQKLQRRRLGKLRGAAEPAVLPVEGAAQPAEGLVEDRRFEIVGLRSGAGRLRQIVADLLGVFEDLCPAVLVGIADGFEYLGESGQPHPVFRRPVGAAVEGDTVRGNEDVERPTAVPRHRLHRRHVDRIEIGPLFAIDFDVDEMLVHDGGGALVLERLVLHHMAPVTGGVADADQHRFVLALRCLQCFLPPRIPIDGIVLVLEEIGARLACQPVRHSGIPFRRSVRVEPSRRLTRALSQPGKAVRHLSPAGRYNDIIAAGGRERMRR